jgi:PadR family transcriptional regulator PadR
LAILHALESQNAGWGHGYDLCRGLDLKAGTVYPILIRLSERGLVETAWEQEPPQGRPARHLYRLSAAGAEYLEALRTPHAVRGVMKRAARPASGAAGA